MAKNPTYPPLFDEVLQISITNLKQWGYLEPEQTKSGVISWSLNGKKTASVSISVNMLAPDQYIELDYKFNNEPRKYQIQFTTIPSSLGNGKLLYFVCPKTGKRAMKLYLINGYFLHREAFNGCMYSCQTQSKKERTFLNTPLGIVIKIESLFEQLRKPYFKTTYAGKPTKKYLKIERQIQAIEGTIQA